MAKDNVTHRNVAETYIALCLVWFGLTVSLKVFISQAKCRRLASVQIIADVLLSVKLYLGIDNEYTTCSAWDH